MNRLCLVALAMTACGRINIDEIEPAGDAADAMRPLCTTAFDVPVVIGELASPYDETCPEMTEDGLEIFWHDTEPAGPGGSDLWTATRTTSSGTFGSRAPVANVNTPFNEGGPSLSFDGLELYFSSERAGNNQGDIYVARRASRDDPFGAPQRIAEIDSVEYESSPMISFDGLTLYFGSNRSGGPGANDIWYATRPARSAPFGVPQLLGVSTGATENTPTITANGLALFYEVTENGREPDVWMATRASTSDPFLPGILVSELSLFASSDMAPAISASGERITFNSDRQGTPDPYVATRVCP